MHISFFIATTLLTSLVLPSQGETPELCDPVHAQQGQVNDGLFEQQRTTDIKEDKLNSVCVDNTIFGFYMSKVHYSISATPLPSGYVTRPTTLSVCELEQLQIDCVDRINQYRSGALKFTDGTSDSNVVAGLTPLSKRTGAFECSSEQAMGDLIANYAGGGGCAGAHTNAFQCTGWWGYAGQNSCCGRGAGSFGSTRVIATYSTVQAELYSCLQQMWDEGQASSIAAGGQTGHWVNMRSTTFTYATCGFAWSSTGRVMMTQDFYQTAAACTPSCTTCGASDGCNPVSTNPCSCGSGTTPTSPTATPTSPTATPTSPSASATRTASASASKSATASATRSVTVTQSTSLTPTKSASVSVTKTATASATPSASRTPTASASASMSKTATPSGSLTPTKSASGSTSTTASRTRTPSASVSPSRSPSPTTSASASKSGSASASRSASTTVSPSKSRTGSASISASVWVSASRSKTASLSASRSILVKHLDDDSVVVASVYGLPQAHIMWAAVIAGVACVVIAVGLFVARVVVLRSRTSNACTATATGIRVTPAPTSQARLLFPSI